MDHPSWSAVHRLSSIVEFKTKSSPSIRDERGLPWCHPGLKLFFNKKNPVVMQQGKEPASLCQVRPCGVYPYSVTGVPELDYLCFDFTTFRSARSSVQLGGPFDFCAFASLSELPLGSLVIALKCTRPRQRFYVWYWAVFYDGAADVSRGRIILWIISHKLIFIAVTRNKITTENIRNKINCCVRFNPKNFRKVMISFLDPTSNNS
jgi:hypothetical protein